MFAYRYPTHIASHVFPEHIARFDQTIMPMKSSSIFKNASPSPLMTCIRHYPFLSSFRGKVHLFEACRIYHHEHLCILFLIYTLKSFFHIDFILPLTYHISGYPTCLEHDLHLIGSARMAFLAQYFFLLLTDSSRSGLHVHHNLNKNFRSVSASPCPAVKVRC